MRKQSLRTIPRDKPTGSGHSSEPRRILGRTYATPGQLANLIGVSRRTLTRWDDARTGPPRIKIGNTILYDLDRLNQWLESQEVSPLEIVDRHRATLNSSERNDDA